MFQIILSVINLLCLVFGLDAVSENVDRGKHEAGVHWYLFIYLLVYDLVRGV